jgi:hypothetical protein
MVRRITTITLLALAGWIGASAAQVRINEIRIDQEGTDVDEYFELTGPALSPLTGLTYLVVGDGTAGCGVVECVVPLGSWQIQADGLLAVCRAAAPGLAGYDVTNVSSIVFENSDNVTHMIVDGWIGALGADLDTNNDGAFDITPWSAVIDCVALIEDAVPGCGLPQADDEAVYCGTKVGPDGLNVPGHVYLCGTSWHVGLFSPIGSTDTPGAVNNCPVPAEASTWGGVKTILR